MTDLENEVEEFWQDVLSRVNEEVSRTIFQDGTPEEDHMELLTKEAEARTAQSGKWRNRISGKEDLFLRHFKGHKVRDLWWLTTDTTEDATTFTVSFPLPNEATKKLLFLISDVIRKHINDMDN